jgi:hypothetical protein
MNVPAHWAKYGFRSADVPFLKSFEAAVARLGWGERQIDATYRWYRDHYVRGADSAEVAQSFVYVMLRAGLSVHEIEDALAWHETIAAHGPVVVKPPPAPSAAQDAQRLSEIRQIAREASDDYFGSEGLQREHYEILERQGEGAALPAPAGWSGGDA